MTGFVHIVDDDPSYLRAVSRLLRAFGFVIKTFTSADEFLAQLTPDTHGCVIVDLQMPGLSGLETQEELMKSHNPMPVLFLTGHGDIPSTVCAMKSGAVDFLEKSGSKERLTEAVRKALDRDIVERGIRAKLSELRSGFDLLTARELEVLKHVVQGWLNKQIAADLGIHERTVKFHRTAITTKLRVQSVAELTWRVQAARIFEDSLPTFPKGQLRGSRIDC